MPSSRRGGGKRLRGWVTTFFTDRGSRSASGRMGTPRDGRCTVAAMSYESRDENAQDKPENAGDQERPQEPPCGIQPLRRCGIPGEQADRESAAPEGPCLFPARHRGWLAAHGLSWMHAFLDMP